MAGVNGKLVTVFGGSGFVGRHVVRALAKRGYRVRVAVRRPDLAGHLQPLGVVGQIHAVQANLRYPDSVMAAVAGSDAVINLVGILEETGRQTFGSVQAAGAKAVAEAVARSGGARLVHMSAIGADAASASLYARSKADGEAAVLDHVPEAVIMRASIIFGPEDGFFNKFADLLKSNPVLPLACPNSRFAPVYVGDVARAFETALENDATIGKSFELCGPRVYTFKELVEDIARMLGKKRLVVGLPDALARLQAKIFGMLPVKIFTTDNYLSLQVDSVCGCNGFEELGITTHSVEGIMPLHFANKTQRRRYDALRQAAGRD